MQMTAAVPDTAEAEARRLFLDDPGRSIDEVARDLNRRGLGLKKHVLSNIRHSVRAVIDQAHHATPPIVRRRDPFQVSPRVQIVTPVKSPEPFDPPRIVQIAKAVELPPVPAPPVVTPISEPPAPTAPVEAAQVPAVPLEERKRWLEDWLLEHPDASVPKAREALLKQFGMTMGTTAISDLVKTVRALHQPPALQPEPEVVVESGKSSLKIVEIADLAHAMKVLGVRKIELHGLHYVVDLDDH